MKTNKLIIPDDFKSEHNVSQVLDAINRLKQAETDIEQFKTEFVKSFILSANQVLASIPENEYFKYKIPEFNLFCNKHLHYQNEEDKIPQIDFKTLELNEKLNLICDYFDYPMYIIDWKNKQIRVCWDENHFEYPYEPCKYTLDMHLPFMKSKWAGSFEERYKINLEHYHNEIKRFKDEKIITIHNRPDFKTNFKRYPINVYVNIKERIISCSCSFTYKPFKRRYETWDRWNDCNIKRPDGNELSSYRHEDIPTTIHHNFCIDTNTYLNTVINHNKRGFSGYLEQLDMRFPTNFLEQY